MQTETLTLDVGLGTFRPIDAPSDRRACDARRTLRSSRSDGQAVLQRQAGEAQGRRRRDDRGRALEGAAAARRSGRARRDAVYITPGFRFRVVDALLTNFHLPGSSLLTMVCAFGGYRRVMEAYGHAVEALPLLLLWRRHVRGAGGGSHPSSVNQGSMERRTHGGPGFLFVVSGPSGAGKDTLVEALARPYAGPRVLRFGDDAGPTPRRSRKGSRIASSAARSSTGSRPTESFSKPKSTTANLYGTPRTFIEGPSARATTSS